MQNTDMNLQVVELEVQEEMMSEFEQGFWDGVTYGALGCTAVGLVITFAALT